jgi:hypothetical protein
MMRITIIVGINDNSVYVDGLSAGGIDLAACGVPDNVWALQWNEHGDNTGHIEYKGAHVQNDEITELPSWVDACIAAMQVKREKDLADQQAAVDAARYAEENGLHAHQH